MIVKAYGLNLFKNYYALSPSIAMLIRRHKRLICILKEMQIKKVALQREVMDLGGWASRLGSSAATFNRGLSCLITKET